MLEDLRTKKKVKLKKLKKRYQNCNIVEKIWRRRWYLLIPYHTFRFYYYTRKKSSFRMSLRHCYKLAVGMAQYKMNWMYGWKEVKERIENKLK